MQVWPDAAAGLREIRRVLAEGGRVALAFTPNSGQPRAGVTEMLSSAGFMHAAPWWNCAVGFAYSRKRPNADGVRGVPAEPSNRFRETWEPAGPDRRMSFGLLPRRTLASPERRLIPRAGARLIVHATGSAREARRLLERRARARSRWARRRWRWRLGSRRRPRTRARSTT